MILTVTLNPCVDKTIALDTLALGAFNHAAAAHDVAGGKATNVARMAKHLGAPVRSLVMLGGESGRLVERLIRDRDGIEPIVVRTQAPTRNIVTVRERDRKRATAYVEPSPEITPAEAEELMARYADALAGTRIVCFGGSAPHPILDDAYARMIRLARERGLCTILDSRGEALRRGVRAIPFMVKPNVIESEGLLGRPLADDEARWQAVAWYRQAGIELVVVTMGQSGALIDWAGRRWRARPPLIEEVNPVGSGDCVVAGFACGILWGWDPERTLRLALAAGAANAAVWDAASPARADVEALMPGVALAAV
ncbi:MAG TPA: 1-phosphofructokinase family hexose kinase [Armatimonadota bacterium]|nr:1-phosphofructokinase family hexose kinase [Armatimonadota bacterium]